MADAPAPPTPAGRPRLRDRRWFRWTRDLLLFATALAVIGTLQTWRHLGRGARPALALSSLSGERVELASMRGRPVLLAVWAPWCPVCKANSGALARAARLAGDRAHVVSVAAAFDDPEEVRATARAEGFPEPVLLADDAAVAALRVESYPTYYFLDAEGRVKRSAAGYTTTLGLLARLLL
jgi:thiol-disulfide isomerase/thioredoxin